MKLKRKTPQKKPKARIPSRKPPARSIALKRSRRRAAARIPLRPEPRRRGMRIRESNTHDDGSRAPSLHGYKSYPLQLPRLPPGVRKGFNRQGLAMDDGSGGPMPGSAFLANNTVYGMSMFGLYFPGYPYLAELAQRSEYRQPVETTAKELTRNWIEFKSRGTGDKSEKIQQIQEAFEEFKVQEVFRKAAMHDGFYGLGQVFIDIAGQNDHALPLVVDQRTIKKGSLRGFVNVEPMWVTPLTYNAIDPTMPDFYKPSAWMVMGRRTDQTRLLNFTSYEIPDIIKPAYNFGGISLTQLIEPYVTRWLKTVGAVNQLINNFSIIYLQTDMDAVLEGESDSDLLKRLRMFTRDRNNQGIFVTDKNRELLQQLAVPLSSLDHLQAQAQEHMAAPTHLPLVVLTGITPSGLNATSEDEIQIFYDWILSVQKHLFRAHIRTILRIIQLHLWGKIDPDITFGFVPLKQVVGEAAARMRKMASDAAIAYIDAGVLDPKEERERLANDPDSGYVNLNLRKKIKPPALQAQELEQDQDDDDDEREVA